MFISKLHSTVLFKFLTFFILTVLIIPQFGPFADAEKPTAPQSPTTTSTSQAPVSLKTLSAETQSLKAPQSLTAASTLQTSISLKWSPSTDKSNTISYLIYKNSDYFASTTGTSYTVSGLSAGTDYSFYVKAKDSAGNISLSSNVLNVTTAAVPIAPMSTSSKIILGYYGGWSANSGYTPLNIPASKLTHINYAFANIGSNLKITLGNPNIDTKNFSKLNELKKKYPNIKTLISVGGWDWSDKFSDVALTAESRKIFADSVIAFIKKYGFNGVDIDWEYPVSGGLNKHAKRPEDKTNFTLLLKTLREKLDAQSSIDGKKYLLTIAGGASSSYTSNTELKKISNYVDFATVMTYDIHGTWDTYTDFNAPLYNPKESSSQYKWSVDSGVKTWISKGFPASKIVLGLPFYGYVYSGVANADNGLYKTFKSGNSVSYDKILSTYLNNSSFIKHNHSDAKVPWLFNGSSFISYDDKQSIAEKAKYIKTNNLAGAAAWELSQNKSGVLLNSLYSNIN